MKIKFTVSVETPEKTFSLGPFSADAETVKEAALRICAVQEAIDCASARPLGKTLVEVFCEEWKNGNPGDKVTPWGQKKGKV